MRHAWKKNFCVQTTELFCAKFSQWIVPGRHSKKGGREVIGTSHLVFLLCLYSFADPIPLIPNFLPPTVDSDVQPGSGTVRDISFPQSTFIIEGLETSGMTEVRSKLWLIAQVQGPWAFILPI